MAYIVTWVRPGEAAKQYKVYRERAAAEQAALTLREAGCDVFLEDTQLEDAGSEYAIRSAGENLGGFRA